MKKPGVAGVVLMLAGSSLVVAQHAAAAGPVYTVMNTSETPPDGVWFRNSPHTADTDRVTGHGVYMGERVQIQCYEWGDAVGPYGTRLWYRVNNVSRPTNAGRTNDGYLNDHYIDDGTVANQVLGGIGQCGAAPPPPTLPPPPTDKLIRNACGLADVWIAANGRDVEVRPRSTTQTRVKLTGYSCLAETTTDNSHYKINVAKYRTFIRNEIRNHAFLWVLHLFRSHSAVANLDFYAYSLTCRQTSHCVEWRSDYYAAGTSFISLFRIFAKIWP